MNLAQKIEQLHTSEHKLLVIVGGPGSGKSKAIREYINANTTETTHAIKLVNSVRSAVKAFSKVISTSLKTLKLTIDVSTPKMR